MVDAGDLNPGNGENAGTDSRSPIEISDALASDAALTAHQVLTEPITPGSAPAPAGAAPETDSAGEPFDPRIHSGTRTRTGRWRRKKGAAREPARSRGARSTDGTARSAGLDGTAPRTAASLSGAPVGGQGRHDFDDDDEGPREPRESAPRADPVACAALARSTVAVLSSTLAMALGAHWRASEIEARELEAAWSTYYQARGVSRALAPEWGLALVLAGYAAPRLAHPKTAEQTASWRERAAVAWARFRVRRGRDFAHPGSRQDGQRENDAAAAARGGVSALRSVRADVVLDPPRV